MNEASSECPLCWIEAHADNPGNTIKQETAQVRKIIKSRCPTLSVRMGLGTARNFIDILGSLDEFGRFTAAEKSCLKSFGIETGLGGGVVMDWHDRERFLKKYEGGSLASEEVLSAVEARLAMNLRKQVQKNLGEVFELTGCTAVGREIRAGRNVTGNAEFGIVTCVHPKSGPRVDPSTLEFFPQSKKGKELDEKFIKLTNEMLETGGFPRMDPHLLSNMRKKDKEFEQDVAARRRKRK